jgi:hypothetical protein
MLTMIRKAKSKTEFTVYSHRARVGYIKMLNDDYWLWELSLMSEQYNGYPREVAVNKEAALRAMSGVFDVWCKAAGLTHWKIGC